MNRAIKILHSLVLYSAMTAVICLSTGFLLALHISAENFTHRESCVSCSHTETGENHRPAKKHHRHDSSHCPICINILVKTSKYTNISAPPAIAELIAVPDESITAGVTVPIQHHLRAFQARPPPVC